MNVNDKHNRGSQLIFIHQISGSIKFLWHQLRIINLIALIILLSPYVISAETLVNGTISVDTTWTLTGSPYVVTGNVVVQGTSGADSVTTLTIEPGTTIRFASGTRLTVGGDSGNPGALVAEGTEASPITFTSSLPTPTPGSWDGIYLNNTTHDAQTKLSRVIMEYGGKNISVYGFEYCYGNLNVIQSSPSVSHCVIRHGLNSGILINSGSPVISNTILTGNGRYGIYVLSGSPQLSENTITGSTSTGIYVSLGTPVITSNTITGSNSNGIYLGPSANATITGNTITGCGTYGIMAANTVSIITNNTFSGNVSYDLYFSGVFTGTITGNTLPSGLWLTSGGAPVITSNTISYHLVTPLILSADKVSEFVCMNNFSSIAPGSVVQVLGGAITKDAFWNNRFVYDVLGNVLVQGVDNNISAFLYDVWGNSLIQTADSVTTLTIEPGTTIRFAPNTRLNIGGNDGNPGALLAEGTEFSPITFTSSSAAPVPGIWDGIYFNNTTDDVRTTLSYSVVEYGGENISVYGFEYCYGNLNVIQSSPVMTHCVIRHGLDSGILIHSGSPVISNTILTGNGRYGIYVLSGAPQLIENNITGGTSTGIYISSGTPVVRGNNITLSGTNGIYLGASANATIDGNTITHCGAYGINAANTISMITNNNFSGNGSYDLYFSGVFNGTITGNTLPKGLWFASGGTPVITSNIIAYDPDTPLILSANKITEFINSNTFSSIPEGSEIKIIGGTIATDALLRKEFIYFVMNNILVQGADGNDSVTTLTIEPGTMIRFAPGTRLDIGSASGSPGALVADGTDTQPITFTSAAAAPMAGDWKGIYINNTASDAGTTLSHDVVEFGGENISVYGFEYCYGNLNVIQSSPSVSHCVIRHGLNSGILINGGSPVISNTTLTGNGRYGIYILSGAPQLIENTITGSTSTGIYVSLGTPVITSNTITGSNTNGIYLGPSANATITGNTITGCGTSGIMAANTTSSITNNTFSENGSYDLFFSGVFTGTITGNTLPGGLWLTSGGTPVITSNTISYHPVTPLILSANKVSEFVSTNTFSSIAPGSVVQVLGGVITKDAFWNNGFIYEIQGNVLVLGVDDNVAPLLYDEWSSALLQTADSVTTLTIQPGTTIRFEAGTRLTVGGDSGNPGALVAEGTESSPVTFTSSSASPTPGSWDGIYLNNTTNDAITTLSHVIMEYGGENVSVYGLEFCYGNLNVIQSSPVVTHCVIRHGLDSGILIHSGSPVISNTILTGNGRYGIYVLSGAPQLIENNITGGTSTGIYISSGTPVVRGNNITLSGTNGIYLGPSANATITGNTITGCGTYGIMAANTVSIITNNTFSGNVSYDLYFSGVFTGTITGNTLPDGMWLTSGGTPVISSNTINYSPANPIILNANKVGEFVKTNTFSNTVEGRIIEVNGGTITTDAVWPGDFCYHILGNVTVQGVSGADSVTTLTIEPGAELRFNFNTRLNVGATSGAPGAMIAKGDQDAPILFTARSDTPAPGDWDGIYVYNTADDSLTAFENCIVQYAGEYLSVYGMQILYGNINLDNASPDIRYCTIKNSHYSGIYLNGAGCNVAEIICNTFKDNLDAINLSGNSQPVIENNNFLTSTNFDVCNNGSLPVYAGNNWWGQASGPVLSGDDADVNGNVVVSSWLIQASNCFTYAVPNLIGMTQENAITAISSTGLLLGTVTQDYSNTIAEGLVMSQNPVAAQAALGGTQVHIVVSLGPLSVPVPDVTGKTRAEAEVLLIAGFLTTGTVVEAYSTAPAGLVFSQDPAAGASIGWGTPVNLMISLGPDLSIVTVPSLAGMGTAAATSALEAAGLTAGRISSQYSASVPEGNVITQDPLSGTQVAYGSAVDLITALKPEVILTGPETVTTSDSFFQVNGAVASSTVKTIASAFVTSNRYPGQQFAVSIDDKGNITGEIPLAVGENILTLTIRYDSGGEITKIMTINVELSALPVIVIQSPVYGSTLSTNKVNLAGIVRSSLTSKQIKLTCGSQVVFPTGENGEYSFAFNGIGLVEGQNIITVVAETPYGSTSGQTLVTYRSTIPVEENVPPKIEISSPRPGVYMKTPDVIVSGTVTGKAAITSVTVNGHAANVVGKDATVSFEASLTIPGSEGVDFGISVIATDANGKSSTVTYAIRYDGTEPLLTLDDPDFINPSDQYVKTESPYELSGTVVEANLAGIKIEVINNTDGSTKIISPDILPKTGSAYAFRANVGLDRNQVCTVMTEAWDQAGNTTAKTVNLILQMNVVPEIIAPVNGSRLIATGDTLKADITVRTPGVRTTDVVTVTLDGRTLTGLSRTGDVVTGNVEMDSTEGERKISVSVKDEIGREIAKTSSTFTIVNSESIALGLLRQEPADQSKGQEPNTSIVFYFNKVVDVTKLNIELNETVNGLEYVKPQPGADISEINKIDLVEIHREFEQVPYGISMLPGGKTIALYPKRDFAYASKVFVKVAYDDQTLGGASFEVRPLPTFIKGIVTDQFMESVNGIEVSIPDLNRTTMTEEEGNFSFGFGETAEKTIPGGRYRLFINKDLKNKIFGAVETWAVVQEGRLNDLGLIKLPIMNTQVPFSQISSGTGQNIFADGDLQLNLENARLTFPDGSSEGAVHAQFSTIDKIGKSVMAGMIPHWMYVLQPAGISVQGKTGVTMAMPPLNGTYDYISNIGLYVVILGLDPDSLIIAPVGVGVVNPDSRTVISVTPVDLKRLDYIGYSLVSEDKQSIVQSYINGKIPLREMMGLLSK